MRRLLICLAVCAAALVPVRPVAAHDEVCAGAGYIQLSSPLLLPVVSPTTGGLFDLHLDVGVCAPFNFGFHAQGIFDGTCLAWVGVGVTNTGHRIELTAGYSSLLVVMDDAKGMFHIVPDATVGSSCATGAWRWRITGVTLLCHSPGTPCVV